MKINFMVPIDINTPEFIGELLEGLINNNPKLATKIMKKYGVIAKEELI